MIELIISLLVIVGLIFGYRKFKERFEDEKALRTIACLITSVLVVVAAMYALFTLIVLLPL